MPCCWPPTASADTSSRPPACSAASWNALHQYEGSTDVPFGCLALPESYKLAGFGVRHAYLAGLRRCVDACNQSPLP